MVMNACITSFYILIGTFDSLVTFIGKWLSLSSIMDRKIIAKAPVGISEYSFFLLAVLGIFILRRGVSSLVSEYRTWTFNPVIFCIFSTLLLVRGVITDPAQGFAIFFVTLIGWAVFKRGFPSVIDTEFDDMRPHSR